MPDNTPDTLVTYIDTAGSQDNATGGVTFGDDGRVLLKGGVQWVTKSEIVQAASHGVMLEEISQKDATNLGLTVPDKPSTKADELAAPSSAPSTTTTRSGATAS